MIRAILFLLICTFPVSAQTIKQQTQKNLMAMTNVSATQVVNGKKYRVAMFGNRQVYHKPIAMPRTGIRPGTEWYSLLQDSQLWKLTPVADHFTYKDMTKWLEISRIMLARDETWEGTVACEGEVYIADNNIVRITQRFNPNRLVKTVSIDMVYDWVQLKEKRLLPATMTMTALFKNGQTHKLNISWVDYNEFGTELLVKDVDETPNLRPATSGDFFAESTSQVDKPEADRPTPIQMIDNPKEEASETPTLIGPVKVPHNVKTVRVSQWKRFLKSVFPKP